jgi:transcriptional regulator with XRE-family HTH domain
MTGAELREERKRRQLTMDDLGQLLGVTRQRVFQLEQLAALTGPQEAAIRHAFAGLDGIPRPTARPVPYACPICGQSCDTGPASPTYVLTEHLRARHADRAGDVIPPAAPLSQIPSNLRGYRVTVGDPGSLVSSDDLTLQVLFGDYPYAIFPLPLDGRVAYQWIPGSVREEGRQP